MFHNARHRRHEPRQTAVGLTQRRTSPHRHTQAPTTLERNTAPLQLSTQRQERTPIDTNLSLTCKQFAAHRICSRCYELHPRFDQKLHTHQDFLPLPTAKLDFAARSDGLLSKAALAPKRLNLKKCKEICPTSTTTETTTNKNSNPASEKTVPKEAW